MAGGIDSRMPALKCVTTGARTAVGGGIVGREVGELFAMHHSVRRAFR